MLGIINHQPETLISINVLFGSKIAGQSATLLAGGLFAILFVMGWFLLRRSWKLSSIVLLAAAIAWLPLGAQFAYSSWREFNDTWFMLSRPVKEQITWRYCRIDKYQGLFGDFCGLYPFIAEVKELVPAGSSIGMAGSSFGPYLMYYLYDSYQVTYGETGEYMILFRPLNRFAYEGGVLSEIRNGQKYELGRYELIAAFSPQQLLFKKAQ